MNISRTTAGIVAGIAATVSAVALMVLEIKMSGGYEPAHVAGLFALVGGGVLWLADHFDLIEGPYTKNVVSLYDDDDSPPPKTP